MNGNASQKSADSFVVSSSMHPPSFQFISSFAQIALPITNLLNMKGEGKPKPSQPLKWMMECQAAFEKPTCLFAAELVLKHPDRNAPFVIQVDISDVAVGGCVAAKKCAYTSKKLRLNTGGQFGKRRHMHS